MLHRGDDISAGFKGWAGVCHEENVGKGTEEQISIFRECSVRQIWLEWEGKLSEVEN